MSTEKMDGRDHGDETDEIYCRHCKIRIHSIGHGAWIDDSGCGFCTGTAILHEPTRVTKIKMEVEE